MFSSILYREEESVEEFISLDGFLKEYVTYEFNKHYHMSIDEFLSLTFFEKRRLIHMIQMKEKMMQEQMDKYHAEQKSKNKNNTPPPMSIGEVEELQRQLDG